MDKSLLGQPFTLFEAFPPAQNGPHGIFGGGPQKKDETQQDLQPSTEPRVTCYLFANKGTGAASGEDNSAVSPPVQKHPFAQFHGLAQPNPESHPLFGHNGAGAEGSESKSAMPNPPQKHPFAAFCDGTQPTIQCQPRIWGRSVGDAGSESKLAPPVPVQKHYFPTSGFPQPQAQPRSLFGPQPTTTTHCHAQTTTSAGKNMSEPTPSLFANLGGTVPVAKPPFDWTFGAKPAASTLGVFEHLEVYILRPHAESTKDSTTWSYKAESLPLDNTAMQAHNIKLGPTYSIIDAVSLLQPQQLHLVQEQVKSREGKLVSVQFGAAVDMPTPMGSSVRISSVIFMLKTTAAAVSEKKVVPQHPVQHSCWGINPKPAEQTKSLFGNNINTSTSNTGGFGSNNNPSESTLLGGCATQPVEQSHSLFGNNTTAACFGSLGSTQCKLSLFDGKQTASSGPNIFAQYVDNLARTKGDELCTFKERDGASTTQQYMTLPAYFEQSGKSFEEARIADQKDGGTREAAAGLSSLFGMNALKKKLESTAISGGDDAGAVNSRQPVFGGWGQMAALSAGAPSLFGAAPVSNSPFATSLNDTKAPAPSLFASMTSNPRPNPFAATTKSTMSPPSLFANTSPHATAAGFGQGPFSFGSSMASGNPTSQLFGSTSSDPKPAATPSLFGAGRPVNPPTLAPNTASKPQPLASGESPAQLFSSTKWTPSQPASTPSLFGAGASPLPPTLTPTSPFATPDTEMAKRFVEAHMAFVNAAPPAEEGLAQEDLEFGKVEDEDGDGVVEKPQGGEKTDGDGAVKEDGEYIDCGDVVGTTDRAE